MKETKMRSLLIAVIFFSINLLTVFRVSSQMLPPLLQTIKNNKPEQVSSLLNNGAAISITDEDGDTPLFFAALYSTTGCMKLLLQKGADPDIQNKRGETAISWCTHDVEKTKLLLDYQARVNIKTMDGNTALLSAFVGQAQTEMIRLMLQHGADPNSHDDYKASAPFNLKT